MSDARSTEIRNKWLNILKKIKSGKITKQELTNTLRSMEKKYGDDAFLSFNIPDQKEDHFTKEYYERLLDYANAGACSKEFFLHLYEVRSSLQRKKTITCGLGAVGVAGFIAILIVVILLTK